MIGPVDIEPAGPDLIRRLKNYEIDCAAFEEFGDETAGFRCIDLEGIEAVAVLERMAEANEATTFVDADGTEYTVLVKPLLPGQESSC